jgi:hypothetical protein
MDVNGDPFGGRHHLVRALGIGPDTNVHQVIALKFTDTYTDFLKLVFGKH